jgi:hypothetical protein
MGTPTVPRRIPKLQFRRGTSAEWAAANPVLAAGEPGVDLDTGDLKIGDGTTAWSSMPVPYAPPAFQTSTPRGLLAVGTAFDPVAHAASAVVDLTGSIRWVFDPTRRYPDQIHHPGDGRCVRRSRGGYGVLAVT